MHVGHAKSFETGALGGVTDTAGKAVGGVTDTAGNAGKPRLCIHPPTFSSIPQRPPSCPATDPL